MRFRLPIAFLILSCAVLLAFTPYDAPIQRLDGYIHNLQHAVQTPAVKAKLALYIARRAEYQARRTAIPAVTPPTTYTQPTPAACVRWPWGDGNCAAFNYGHDTYRASPNLPSEMVIYSTRLYNDGGPVPFGKLPVFVTIPGGPVRFGESATEPLDTTLAFRGAVVFHAEYRSQRAWGGGSPQAMQDVGCAIRAARTLASKYGGDPSRVTLVAHSFGGWVSNQLIFGDYTPGVDCLFSGKSQPDQYVSIAAISDNTWVSPGFIASDYPDALDIRSVIGTTTRRLPILVVQGQIDIVAGLVATSASYYADLVRAGFSVRYLSVPAQDHTSILGARATVDAVIGAK